MSPTGARDSRTIKHHQMSHQAFSVSVLKGRNKLGLVVSVDTVMTESDVILEGGDRVVGGPVVAGRGVVG